MHGFRETQGGAYIFRSRRRTPSSWCARPPAVTRPRMKRETERRHGNLVARAFKGAAMTTHEARRRARRNCARASAVSFPASPECALALHEPQGKSILPISPGARSERSLGVFKERDTTFRGGLRLTGLFRYALNFFLNVGVLDFPYFSASRLLCEVGESRNGASRDCAPWCQTRAFSLSEFTPGQPAAVRRAKNTETDGRSHSRGADAAGEKSRRSAVFRCRNVLVRR